jgi:tetratricopeptide (TPR) repeat protein
MGNYNFGIKNFDIALSYFIKSYNIVKSSGSKLFPIDWYANTVGKIGECYENLNKLDSSLKYYRLSFNLYNRIDFQEGLRTSSYRLFKLFDKLNKFDSAYHYQKRYLIVNDSILNNEKLTLLNNISMTENIKQIEKNEEIKKLAIEKDRNIKLGLIAIFIPTFFCIVYILSRKKKRNTKIVSILGLASLLMLFEFISMLIHPVIEHLTNHDTLIMYICLLIIATILIPLHHKLEQFVKSKL